MNSNILKFMTNIKFLLICSLVFLLTSCSSLRGLKSFASCDFSMNSISKVRLGSTNVSEKKSIKDLSVADAAQLVASYFSNALSLSFNVNVDVKNDNKQIAKLNGLDYIVWIDDTQMLTGPMSQNVTVEPGETVTMPLNFTFNLCKALSGKSKDKTLAFGFGLATKSARDSRIKLSFKPYLSVGSKQIKFPTYITIGGDQVMPKN